MDNQSQFIFDNQITTENIQFYQNYGYLIAPELISIEEVALLKKDTIKIFRGEYGSIEGMHPVEIGETDAEILKKYVAIHFPHKISPVIKAFLAHEKIVKILKNIVSPNIKCMQSMLFVKGPGKAGQSWHQDEFYIPTRDKSLTGAWIAIDDATTGNGCLWIIPGSHKVGFIMDRVPNRSDEYADVDTIDTSGWEDDQKMPVEVKRGSVVFFNGYLLHSSQRNKMESNFRTALVIHYMSAESMLPWDQDGKLSLTEDFRDIIVVAGNDPYIKKSTVDISKPYLRPEILVIKTNRTLE